MKKLIIWTIMTLLVLLFPWKALASEPLLVNGDFETLQSGSPIGWSPDAYQQGEQISKLTLQEGEAHSGSHFVRVDNLQANDARWVQTVQVQPSTVYKLSAWVRAKGAGSGQSGANLSVMGVMAMSQDLKDTNGEWKQLALYGKTGSEQTELLIALRVGAYGGLNTGTADFDDVQLEPVAEAPAGQTVQSFSPGEQAQAQPQSPADKPHPGFAAFAIIAALAYIGFCVWAYSSFHTGAVGSGPLANAAASRRLIWMLLGGGLLIRLIGAPILEGHPIDATDFSIWASHAFNDGLSHFYTKDMFVDYPPGYIFVLYFIGMFKQVFGMDSHSGLFLIVLKMPAMLADLLGALVIYKLALKRWDERMAAIFALACIVNPGVYLNSAIWAQIDSVFTLVALLMVIAIDDKKLRKASLLYVVAFLIKPQTVIFTPLLIYAFFTQKSWKTLLTSAAYGIGLFVIAIIPFSVYQSSPLWIVDHYKEMFLSYPMATLNAANWFGLIGYNGVQATEPWLFMSMSMWGNVFVVLIVALSAFLYFISKRDDRVYYLAFLISLLVFVFRTSMHERYGYPAVILALAAYAVIKDRRIFYMFAALSLTMFANVAYVFKFSLNENYWMNSDDNFFRFISLLNVLISLYAVYVGWSIYVKNKTLGFVQRAVQDAAPRVTQAARKSGWGGLAQLRAFVEAKMTRKDKLLMSGLTLVYLIVALVNLGSFKAPQTYWKPLQAGQSFYLDFGQSETFQRIMWYGGIGDGSFQIEQSSDTTSWQPVMDMKFDGSTVFQWKQSAASFTAQYVKVTATAPGATFYELAFFREPSGGQAVPVTAKLVPVSGMDAAAIADAQKLFDEPGTAPKSPSYLNSMYFDEIYHGRTAYEHLHHMEPYENTHPPLGKVLMSFGVALFGMTPFGWRIAGTLFGVAMLPIMYLFGKKLFGRTEYAFISSFLMAVDFMHFTQSRIATIDVYGVFFIIMMYYFMYKFYVLFVSGGAWKQTLLNLSLAGLFFGIGAASKWIDIYAGAGLAAILLLTLIERYRQYQAANRPFQKQPKHKTKEREERESAEALERAYALKFPRQFLIVIGVCLVMFVAVPAVIYVLSYIPFMMVPGPGHGLPEVVSYQKFMFNYHSHLVATHPFASTWWQWPIMSKPMWYYGGAPADPSHISSIVALGNPAVWWVGTIAVFIAAALTFRRKDRMMLVVLIGLAAEYLPWVGVPRLTFIYHFFASVPFLIFCITYVIKIGIEQGAFTKKAVYTYLGAALLLFLMFYPVLSGMEVSRSYASHFLRWFSGWIFFS
ncbi:glycosyltransferase family 39 protein [Paenibacillus athensensis]|uniref:Polyprenol-phosphate-mannose--protein mannosyltransferase n=1 Tax=Paenibacillus athensensis TaxID=1967502 RepID=A0A4Y8Q169_9BACL|nr:glycosyltransferase family 39 protein [Paenibacillus athensensis]MCD1261140.1 glycosyltransferase family 39 protein [Paenibacillus athensensis]